MWVKCQLITFVCVYITLTAVQSLHVQEGGKVGQIHPSASYVRTLLIFLSCFCVVVPVHLTLDLLYIAPPIIVSGQTHSVWSLEYLL